MNEAKYNQTINLLNKTFKNIQFSFNLSKFSFTDVFTGKNHNSFPV